MEVKENEGNIDHPYQGLQMSPDWGFSKGLLSVPYENNKFDETTNSLKHNKAPNHTQEEIDNLNTLTSIYAN